MDIPPNKDINLQWNKTLDAVFFASQQQKSKIIPNLALPSEEEIEKTRRQASKLSKNKHLTLNPPSEIIRGQLYLCSAMESYHKENLVTFNVSHVLCVMEKPLMPYPEDFKYKFLVIQDEESEAIYQYLEEVSDYIHSIISSGGTVCVHCFAGHSRSATFIVAYLMKYLTKTFEEALDFVRQRRSSASPNEGFLNQLAMFGEFLTHQSTTPASKQHTTTTKPPKDSTESPTNSLTTPHMMMGWAEEGKHTSLSDKE